MAATDELMGHVTADEAGTARNEGPSQGPCSLASSQAERSPRRTSPSTDSAAQWHSAHSSGSRHNGPVRAFRELVSHPLTGSGIRYGISGCFVALVYPGIPLALNAGAHVDIQVAIPIAYLLAVTLHFNLQSHFVFRHVEVFALSRRERIGRYVVMGAFQYPTTAIATALLPRILGLSAAATFVVVTLTMSLTIFLLLRTHIFHGDEPVDAPPGESSASQLEIGELEFHGGCGGAAQCEPDAVQSPMQSDREPDTPADDRHRDRLATRGSDLDRLG